MKYLKAEHWCERLEDCWNQTSRAKKQLLYICFYSIAFVTAFLIAYSPFLISKTSFIWGTDGRTQHYPLLVYVGRYLRRQALKFLHGEFTFPLFDLSIGMGGDVIGLLNPMGATEPLVLLSAIVPAQYSEYLYGFLTIFRVYLAGLSFCILCVYFKKNPIYALIGSIIYCFSGYGCYVSMRHPLMVTSMFLLPLLIIGTDKILNKEKPYILIFTVFYSALNGYYFFYMMTIMVVVYAFIRFFDLYRENRVKEFLFALGRGIIGYCLGLGMAAIIFLPSIANYLNASRSEFSNFNPITYSWSYFRNHFLRLVAPSGGMGWTNCTLAAITLFAVVLLFFSKNKHSLKVFTILVFATWLTDVGGLIMNGFQYSSNRWTFGFALVLAFVVVEMLPELLSLTKKQHFLCAFVICLYMAITFFSASARKLTYVTVGFSFLALTMYVLSMPLNMSMLISNPDKPARNYEKNFRAVVCLLLVIVNVGVNGIYWAASDQGNYISSFKNSGYETKRLFDSIERELEPYLLENPSGRTDSSSFLHNIAMVWRIPSMISYFSVTNGNTIEFWKAIELSENSSNFRIRSTEQKTIAGTLLSEKYHIESEKSTSYVPFGYFPIKRTDRNNTIYENKYALPWGYTYDTMISYDELNDMNGVKKQEAMLQAIALDNVEPKVKSHALSFDETEIPYEISYKDCNWEDDNLVISKANAAIILNFNMPADVEGYVRLSGFDINESGLTSFSIKAQCEDVARSSLATSHLYNWYYGRENYLFNLGYSDKERTSLTITFPSKGTFQLKDIELYALPMNNYPERVEALRAEPLENIEWGTNRLSGTVDLSKDKILCVSVPYSKGWSATVDGEKVIIQRGNYMFMAIPLTAGHHDIEFKYCTPGLKLGAVISAISIGVIAAMIISDRRKLKKR